jgi:hypothetical protein
MVAALIVRAKFILPDKRDLMKYKAINRACYIKICPESSETELLQIKQEQPVGSVSSAVSMIIPPIAAQASKCSDLLRCSLQRLSLMLCKRLRPAWQRPAFTRVHARAGDWRFCVLRDSDRLLTQWRH